MTLFLNRICMLWAGVTLGGSLLAAPAKFQVESLSLPVALQVGRVQFLWVWYGEIFCLLILTLWWLLSLKKADINSFDLPVKLLFLAVLLFALQHLFLMPPLKARSESVIAGNETGESHLHVYYVIVEALKFLSLLGAGLITLKPPLNANDGVGG